MRVIAIFGVRTYLWHEGGRFDCNDTFSPSKDGKKPAPESRQLETIYLCRPGLRLGQREIEALCFDDLWTTDPERTIRPACLAFDEKRNDWLVANAIGKYVSEEDAPIHLKPKPAACQPPKPAES